MGFTKKVFYKQILSKIVTAYQMFGFQTCVLNPDTLFYISDTKFCVMQLRYLAWHNMFLLKTKLERIIWLKNIIQKYSVFLLLFSTRIGSKQASLFVLYKKRIPFFKSNNVEYCQIVAILGHFWWFWAIFTCFLLIYINK